MAEKLLTIREVAALLGLTEKEVIDLAENSSIPAYKVGGVYLRFKREQVEEYKKVLKATHAKQKISLKDTVIDFVYFNDFYIFSFLLILALVYVVLLT